MQTVVYVDHSPVFGGAERSLLLLMEGLRGGRYRPVLVTEEGSALDVAARSAGIRVAPVHLGKIRLRGNPVLALLRLGGGVLKIARAVRRSRARIVHANVMRAAPYAGLAAKLTGARFVWHVRDIHKERWFSRLVGALADVVVANSAASAEALPDAVRRKTVVVHNGVDLSRFHPGQQDRAAFRASIGVPDGAPLIGNVGWVSPWKNQMLFVGAAAKIMERRPDARFVLVGQASDPVYFRYWADVQEKAKALLGDHVVLTGSREDIAGVLGGLDVLLHTAMDEPFGRVVIEAMAMGTPVVALAGGGVDEIVVDGVTGALVKRSSDDAARLADAVIALIDDKERSEAFGRAGLQRATQHFDSRVSARQIELIYDRLR